MNKWVIIFLGTIIGFIVVFVGSFFLKQKEIISPVSEEMPTPSPIVNLPSKNLKEYHDASGFKFSYSEDLTITERELKDEKTYADLEITSPVASGSISLKVVETKFKALDEWFQDHKNATISAEVKEINLLADIKSKEIKSKDKILTLGLDQGALFTIEINPQTKEQYWTSVYNTLISTFAFADSEKTQEPQIPATGGEVFFEGEEIIE